MYDFGERVNFLRRDFVLRLKDLNFIEGFFGLSSMKIFGVVFLGGKEVVEGFLFKVKFIVILIFV